MVTCSFGQAFSKSVLWRMHSGPREYNHNVSSLRLAAGAAEECKRLDAKLLIVDTLAQFAGLVADSENDSGAVLEAVRPLQAVASQGVGVLVLNHDRKSGGDVGDATRGSSALPGAADVVLSPRRPEGNSRKSLRVVQSLSRFSETPEELVIELTGQAYIALGEKADHS